MSEIFNGKGKKKEEEEAKKQKELYSKWTKEQEFLLAEWAEKASCYRWLHGRAEKKYRRSNYAFTIPVIIMSTLTGTANFAMDSFVPAEHKKTAMAAVGGVNIFAGIISTLQNFLRYAELMEAHRSSGVAWSKLGRDICIELALDPPRRKPARDFLNICRAEYDRLIEQSPLMDDSIIAQFHSKFKNLDINKPEMCNGLDKCEIYQPSKEEKAAEIMANVTTKLSNTKQRMFTIDKPPPPPQSPVKSSIETSKHELHGLANLGRVSRLKNLKNTRLPVVPKDIKKQVKDELKKVMDIKDIESLLPETPKPVEVVVDIEEEVVFNEKPDKEPDQESTTTSVEEPTQDPDQTPDQTPDKTPDQAPAQEPTESTTKNTQTDNDINDDDDDDAVDTDELEFLKKISD